MDGDGDGGVTEAIAVNEQELVTRAAIAVNEQVLPQLAHLAHGPLAFGALHTLRAAAERNESIAGTVMQVRVRLDDRLYELAVHVVVTPT